MWVWILPGTNIQVCAIRLAPAECWMDHEKTVNRPRHEPSVTWPVTIQGLTGCGMWSSAWGNEANKLVTFSRHFKNVHKKVELRDKQPFNPTDRLQWRCISFFCFLLKLYLKSKLLLLVETILFMLEMKRGRLNPPQTSLPQQIRSNIPLCRCHPKYHCIRYTMSKKTCDVKRSYSAAKHSA